MTLGKDAATIVLEDEPGERSSLGMSNDIGIEVMNRGSVSARFTPRRPPDHRRPQRRPYLAQPACRGLIASLLVNLVLLIVLVARPPASSDSNVVPVTTPESGGSAPGSVGALAFPSVSQCASRSTKLLLHGDAGSGIRDDSGCGHSVHTIGNAAISADRPRFGNGSIALLGRKDFVFVDYSPDWTFEDDFTVEFWARWPNLLEPDDCGTGVSCGVMDHFGHDVGDHFLHTLLTIRGLVGKMRFGFRNVPDEDRRVGIDAHGRRFLLAKMCAQYFASAVHECSPQMAILRPDRWHHIAWSKKDGMANFFLDGQLLHTNRSVWSVVYGHPVTIFVGAGESGGSLGQVHLDEVRISPTVGHWSSDFVLADDAYEE